MAGGAGTAARGRGEAAMACPCGNPGCDGPLDHGRTAALIRRHGWAAVGVGGRPPFTYTIGLHASGRPEVVVLGLPAGTAHGILSEAVPLVLRGDLRHGTVTTDLGQGGYKAAFVALPPAEACRRHLVQAREFFGGDVEALQLVWADRRNLLPWEEGYAPGLAGVQDAIVPLREDPFAGPA